MSWAPKIVKVEPTGEISKTRPWVAVAEEHAEDAVRFLVSVLNDHTKPAKIRMEAAVRVLQVAGTGFRGEKRDAHGRPSANAPKLPSGNPGITLTRQALSDALKQLPPGAAVRNIEDMDVDKEYVVFQDGAHNRKPTGCNPVNPIGGVVRLEEEEYDDGRNDE